VFPNPPKSEKINRPSGELLSTFHVSFSFEKVPSFRAGFLCENGPHFCFKMLRKFTQKESKKNPVFHSQFKGVFSFFL